MHSVRIVWMIEKGRLHEQQVHAVCNLYQGLGGPSVAGVHHGASAGVVFLNPDGVRLYRMVDPDGPNGKGPDPLAGLPGMPVEMLVDGGTMLADAAVATWHLIRLGDPRCGVGRAIYRPSRPCCARRITCGNVVAAQVQAVVSVQMAQRDGVELTRVKVAVERTHGAGTAVEQQRERPTLKRRLHQIAGGRRVGSRQ